MKKYVVASGYFDPIHMGHIEYLQRSKEQGDVLIVIVNNCLTLNFLKLTWVEIALSQTNLLLKQCQKELIY